MRVLSLALALSLLCVAGCDRLRGRRGQGDEGVADASTPGASAFTPAAPTAQAGGARFSEDVEKRDCELMTAAMVSKVSGVPESELNVSTPAGGCSYAGGGVTARLMFVDVGKDAKTQAERFSRAYRNKTAAEVQEDMAKVSAQVDRRLDAGKIDGRTARGAKAVGNAVASGPLSSGLTYRELSGPWDKALLDESIHTVKVAGREYRSHANKIHVLVSNLEFSITYETRGEAVSHEAKLVELAKVVTEALPQ